MSTDPNLVLPPEVFAHVMGWVGGHHVGWVAIGLSGGATSSGAPHRDVASASLVCRAWRSAVMGNEALWRGLCLAHLPPSIPAPRHGEGGGDDGGSGGSGQLSAEAFVVSTLGVARNTWLETLRSSSSSDAASQRVQEERGRPKDTEVEEEEDEGVVSTMVWYNAFKLLMRRCGLFSWDPQAKSRGLEINASDRRTIHHTKYRGGYQWARTVAGFTQGVHRWQVTVRALSPFVAIGLLPGNFIDWTGSSWDWSFKVGYFYQPYNRAIFAKDHVPKPVEGTALPLEQGPSGHVDLLVVRVTLNLDERTITFNRPSYGGESEITNKVSLKREDTIFFPAIVAAMVQESFHIEPLFC